jgi:hypothetical protein
VEIYFIVLSLSVVILVAHILLIGLPQEAVRNRKPTGIE